MSWPFTVRRPLRAQRSPGVSWLGVGCGARSRARSSLPQSRRPETPPGSAVGALPVPVRRPARRGPGRALRPPTPTGCPPRPPRAGGPGCVRPPAARRAPRRTGRCRRPRAGRRARVACAQAASVQASRASASARSRSAVRASAADDAGPEGRPRAAGAARAAPGCGRRPGRRCAGPPTARGPARAAAARTSARARARNGRRTRPLTAAIPARDRAPGAARQPQQHRLGLVVAGVAQQDDGGAEPVRRLVEGGVPSPARGVLGSPARPDRTR